MNRSSKRKRACDTYVTKPVLRYTCKQKNSDRESGRTEELKGEKIMSEMEKKIEKMADEALGTVAGGTSANYTVAVDVINGKYGNGEERRRRLTAAGYDYETVQAMVNTMLNGYDKVARDVIEGKYGNGQARVNALKAAGYDAAKVQALVNEILK